VRTYNFPENRISDHRVNFKAYNLDQVLDGDLDAVIQALVDADAAARLAASSDAAAGTAATSDTAGNSG
jgi:peptide chain release factor 1